MRNKRVRAAADKSGQSLALLSSLSDDLALPFVQIKTSLEASALGPLTPEYIEKIRLSVEGGLQLIEAYRLVLKVGENLPQEFEPVAIGAVLQDVAHMLHTYAKKYNADLRVDVHGSLTPVLAHQPSLFAAMQVLGSSMIQAQAAQEAKDSQIVVLGAHRGINNLVATGVFGNIHGVSDKALRTARNLMGKARQPLPALPLGTASGVLIADMLCSSMWQPLRAAAHGGMHGLATFVPASKQLQLI